MALRWKVCGIRDAATAAVAVEAGADAIGFVFYPPSPRHVSCAQAANVAGGLPRATWRVGVFVDRTPEEISRVVETVGLDFVQLSGNEPPGICADLPRHAFKSLHLTPETAAADARAMAAQYPECTLLVDTAVPGMYGGTGVAANWEAAAALAGEHRLMLAGGLRAENVRDAVERVQPWAIDVSSGVESSPGVKDHGLIRRLGQVLESIR